MRIVDGIEISRKGYPQGFEVHALSAAVSSLHKIRPPLFHAAVGPDKVMITDVYHHPSFSALKPSFDIFLHQRLRPRHPHSETPSGMIPVYVKDRHIMAGGVMQYYKSGIKPLHICPPPVRM
jgi:hypothetical protein